MNCIFCKIIDGSIPSYTIYENSSVKCFLDISPDSNGHVLIIPKQHFTDIDDIDTYTLNEIMTIAKLIKKRLEEKLKIDGLTLIQNNGDIQEVKHYHLHLKPHYKEKQTLMSIDEVFNLLK